MCISSAYYNLKCINIVAVLFCLMVALIHMLWVLRYTCIYIAYFTAVFAIVLLSKLWTKLPDFMGGSYHKEQISWLVIDY